MQPPHVSSLPLPPTRPRRGTAFMTAPLVGKDHLQGVHLLLCGGATDEVVRRVDQDFVEDLVEPGNEPEMK